MLGKKDSYKEWKKEEEYLRQQHKNGWEFVRADFVALYHFKKCEPRDVVYQLDYNPESTDQKGEYIQTYDSSFMDLLFDHHSADLRTKPV